MISAVARVSQEPHALVMRVAFDAREEVLEEQRHPSERTVGQRAARVGARLVETGMDDRVQLGIELLDARDRVVDQLERGSPARADELGLRRRIEKGVRHV